MDIYPTHVRILDRPAFAIYGKKTYISGPDNEQFGRFWQQCRADGGLDWLRKVQHVTHSFPGLQTNSAILGVSRVEQDPTRREFDYMIAVEISQSAGLSEQTDAGNKDAADEYETYQVPAGRWAVFECSGPVPGSIVAAEMYAFLQWLPQSGYQHAHAPEMEVYLTSADGCEFWLPIE